MVKILIAGYHGFGNTGDEAILLAMKTNISKMLPDAKITALSYSPEDTKRNYGINSVQRFNFFSVMSAIIKTDIILCGGGSLLQDDTSTRSLMYYLSILFCGKLFGKKIMLYSNGIGPVHKKSNRKMIKRIVDKVDLITLREENSYKDLTAIGVTKPVIHVTADPAFMLVGVPRESAIQVYINENIPLDKPILGVSVRDWKNDRAFTSVVSEVCDYVINTYGYTVVFVPMENPSDVSISEDVASKMKSTSYILKKKYASDVVLGVFDSFDLVISMRLHSLIFSTIQKKPLIGIVYDPKVESFLSKLGMPSAGDINKSPLDTAEFIKIIDDMIKNYAKHKALIIEKSKELTMLSKENDRYLLEMIKK